MVGRIGITDVQPVGVVRAAIPRARSSARPVLAVSATVFREGHDAVGGRRRRGAARTARRRPFLRMAPRRCPAPTGWSRRAAVPTREGAVDLHASRRWSDPLGHLAARRRGQGRGRAGAVELANDLEEGARLLERRRRRPAARASRGRRSSAAVDGAARRRPRPGGRARWPPRVPRCRGRCCTTTRSASWSPAEPRTRAGSTGSARSTAPGTSSSRARGRRARRRRRAALAARSRTAAERLPAVAADGLRRRLPAADPPDRRGQPQGPEQHPAPPSRPTPARRGRSARAEGGHDAVHPELGTMDDFDAFVAAHPRAGHGGRAGPRAAVRAGPPVGHRAPGVVHHPGRRHDRLRGEPAEEVPGHLPAQLRQRPGGPLRRGAAGRRGTGSRHGVQDLPGRQPAHQAAELLAVADRRGQDAPTRTCCSWPRPSPGRR